MRTLGGAACPRPTHLVTEERHPYLAPVPQRAWDDGASPFARRDRPGRTASDAAPPRDGRFRLVRTRGCSWASALAGMSQALPSFLAPGIAPVRHASLTHSAVLVGVRRVPYSSADSSTRSCPPVDGCAVVADCVIPEGRRLSSSRRCRTHPTGTARSSGSSHKSSSSVGTDGALPVSEPESSGDLRALAKSACDSKAVVAAFG